MLSPTRSNAGHDARHQRKHGRVRELEDGHARRKRQEWPVGQEGRKGRRFIPSLRQPAMGANGIDLVRPDLSQRDQRGNDQRGSDQEDRLV